MEQVRQVLYVQRRGVRRRDAMQPGRDIAAFPVQGRDLIEDRSRGHSILLPEEIHQVFAGCRQLKRRPAALLIFDRRCGEPVAIAGRNNVQIR